MAEIERFTDVDVIGGAGDGTSEANAYSSMNIWNSAEATDLPTDGDTHLVHCMASLGSADTTKVNVNAWVTGSGNELTIQSDIEDRHTGVGDTGYRIVVAGGFDPAIRISEDYVFITGIAVKNTQAGQDQSYGFEVKTVGTGLRLFDSCLAYECGTNGFHVGDASDGNGFVNCFAYSNGQGADGGSGFHTTNNDYYYNCVSVNNNSGTTFNGSGFYYTGFGEVECKNCYAGGNDADDFNDDDGDINITTCHSADLTGNTQTALSTSSGAYFINVTAGSEDCKIASSSDLIDAGTDLSADATFAFDYDFQETSRPAGDWDVGAFEFVGAGGVSIPVIIHHLTQAGGL